jgi:hypothetical protein
VFVSCVSQTRDNKRGVKGSMLSSRLLDDVFVSRVSQTRDNIRGVKGSMLSSIDARRACYPLHHVYCFWFDSHGTRTRDITDARTTCYHLHHVYCLWFESHDIRGVKGSMLSSCLLDDVFMSRGSETRDNIRGVKGSMFSSRLLDHVNTSYNRRKESMLPFTPRILSLV